MHRRLFGLLAVMALVLAACSGGGTASPSAAATAAPSVAAPTAAASPSEAAAEPVTIEWWNLQVNDPGKTLLKTLADEYMAAHPNVTINETVLENEALKTKIATAMQAGTPPDVFQSWGGGGLAEQVAAGLVKDITAGRRRPGRRHDEPRRHGHLPGRRQAVRHPVQLRDGRLLVQQGPVHAGRHHRRADDVGRAPRRRRQAQGRQDHPDRPRRQGQVAGHVLVGLPRRSAAAARRPSTRRSRTAPGTPRRSSRPAPSSRRSST